MCGSKSTKDYHSSGKTHWSPWIIPGFLFGICTISVLWGGWRILRAYHITAGLWQFLGKLLLPIILLSLISCSLLYLLIHKLGLTFVIRDNYQPQENTEAGEQSQAKRLLTKIITAFSPKRELHQEDSSPTSPQKDDFPPQKISEPQTQPVSEPLPAIGSYTESPPPKLDLVSVMFSDSQLSETALAQALLNASANPQPTEDIPAVKQLKIETVENEADNSQPQDIDTSAPDSNADQPEQGNLLTPRGKKAIEQAKGYVDEHFLDSNLSLEQVSAGVNLSPSYLSRLFPEITGDTFSSYLNRRRVNYSCQLLLDNSLSIQDIALRCGFSSRQSFHRVFCKYIGISPSEFRNNPPEQGNTPE